MELAAIPEAENTQLEASVVHDLKFGRELSLSTCKICLGSTPPLSLPCKCKGSMAFVHEDCLSTWINTKRLKIPVCELCQQPYCVTPLKYKVCSLSNMLKVPSCYFVPFILACAGLLLSVLVFTGEDLGNTTNLGSFVGCLVALLILTGALWRILLVYRKRYSFPKWKVTGEVREEAEGLKVNIEPGHSPLNC